MLFVYIQSEYCVACGICVHVCPVKAIIGTYRGKFIVLSKECIGCFKCISYCFSSAVKSSKKRKLFLYSTFFYKLNY